MTKPSAKITIPEIVDRFLAYYKENRAWGSLHIVLDDNNVDNDDVEFCIGWAQEHKDTEGETLARILLDMSKSQRLRLPWKVHQAEDRELGRIPDTAPTTTTYRCTRIGDTTESSAVRSLRQDGTATLVTAALLDKIREHLKSCAVPLRPITVAGKPYYVTAEELRDMYPDKYDHSPDDPIVLHVPDLMGRREYYKETPAAFVNEIIDAKPLRPLSSFRSEAARLLGSGMTRRAWQAFGLPPTWYPEPIPVHQLPNFTERTPLAGTVRLQ